MTTTFHPAAHTFQALPTTADACCLPIMLGATSHQGSGQATITTTDTHVPGGRDHICSYVSKNMLELCACQTNCHILASISISHRRACAFCCSLEQPTPNPIMNDILLLFSHCVLPVTLIWPSNHVLLYLACSAAAARLVIVPGVGCSRRHVSGAPRPWFPRHVYIQPNILAKQL